MTFREAEIAYPGFRAYCLDNFVGNECDTDEYRETQPMKGLGYIVDWVNLHEVTPDEIDLIASWTATLPRLFQDRYAGSEELKPILTAYFNVKWEAGEHPYDKDADLILGWYLQDMEEAK